MSVILIDSVNESTHVATTTQAHGLTTGWVLGALPESDGANVPAPLDIDDVYYVRVLTATTLTLHASAADATSGSNPVEILQDAAGVMLERLSIKERLERNIVQVLAQVDDVAGVTRPSIDDLPLGDRWIVVTPDDEDAAETVWPAVTLTLPLQIEIHLLPPESSRVPQSVVVNRWIGRLIAAVMADRHQGLPRNVLDTQLVGTSSYQLASQNPELVCGIEVNILYRYRHSDPFKEGI